MAFWSTTQLEPKRSFKYLMNISAIGLDYIIKTTDKPSFEISETEHQFLNHTYYYPGRVTWSEVTVTMVDPVSPDASATLHALLNQAGYTWPGNTNEGDYGNVMTKDRAVGSLGQVTISQIGENQNDILEEWILHNAWIKNVEFGSLDYGSEDMVEISVTLRFDSASIRGAKGSPIQ